MKLKFECDLYVHVFVCVYVVAKILDIFYSIKLREKTKINSVFMLFVV